MNAAQNRILGSFELRMIDNDLAHLRVAVDAILREPNRTLPIAYWRCRLNDLLRKSHLLPHQFAVVTGLLQRLDESEVYDLSISNRMGNGQF
jgi:hypothetical protein